MKVRCPWEHYGSPSLIHHGHFIFKYRIITDPLGNQADKSKKRDKGQNKKRGNDQEWHKQVIRNYSKKGQKQGNLTKVNKKKQRIKAELVKLDQQYLVFKHLIHKAKKHTLNSLDKIR